MTGDQHRLFDQIEISRRFLRSVSIEKDSAGDYPNGEYIVTPTARQTLQQLMEGLEKRSPHRAWTVTGPYGVGKSAFGVFINRLLCDQTAVGKNALRRLEEVDPLRAREVSKLRMHRNRQKLLFPVLLTARRVPASVCLLEGVVAACSRLSQRTVAGLVGKATTLAKAASKGLAVDSREVVNRLADLSRAVERRGFAGLLLIIDELGKLFEYAAHAPQKGDVFVLQELAEYASRSGDIPVLVLGILHQSFEEYGRHLDTISRAELAKIQGRFQDVAFLEPPEQVLRMIVAAVKWKGDGMPPALRSGAKQLAEQSLPCGVCPPGMKRDEFIDICVRAYPIHPCALVALPHLFHRFAQNERSLFSYLSSHEPKGFQDFLRTHVLDPKRPAFIRLPDLFDYFTANFGAGLFRQPHARRWLEAADVLERKEKLTELDADLVKTVGMLNALGTFCHLSATKSMVSFGVAGATSSAEVQARLEALAQKSVITYRRFNETYRIWEGSDVDVEERISEGHRRTRANLQLADAIHRYLPARPIVARRHSFETGTLRYFEVRYVDDPASIQDQATKPTQASGLILVCLSPSGSHLGEFEWHATKGEGAKQDVLFAVPQEIGEIRSTLAELAALQWAWDNTHELRDDRVARRELAMRIADTRQLLTKGLSRLLDPREEPAGCLCLWYYRGQKKPVRKAVDVAQLLSDVCDDLYPESPRTRNELIARRTLSSAAAAARRNLVERMFSHVAEEALGLEGYPPERSMYESVLRATRLHRQNAEGRWRLAEPPHKDPCNLRPTWHRLCDLVFTIQAVPVAVDEVFRAISQPPYGVPDGLHPVLLCAFLGAYPNEVTLYREGTFVPEPSITEFEVLMRRPELFAIAGCRITGGRAVVVDRIAKGLGAPPATAAVVRALFRMLKGLPEFARSTMKLSAPTLALRHAFTNAKSPERFLFAEVPEALQVPPFGKGKPERKHVDTFFNALNGALQEWSRCTHLMIDAARDTLLEACGLPCGMDAWPKLREIAHSLEPGLTNPVLLPFVRRVAQVTGDQVGVESVLAYVANRPPQMWTDGDVDRFPASARVLGNLFKETATAIRPAKNRVLGSLKPSERKQAQHIAQGIRKYLRSSGNDLPAKIIRAALSIILSDDEQGTA